VSTDARNPAWRIRTHGYGGYSRGCRCEVCKSEKAFYMRDKRAVAARRRRAAQFTGKTYVAAGVYHGTAASYQDAHCRCSLCCEAKRQAGEHSARRRAERLAVAS
jgi:hypothetical protein